jgi:hypothetical protein
MGMRERVKLKRSITVGLVALLFSLVGMASGVMGKNVSAATAGLTLSPASLDTKIAPGSSYHGTLHVINEGTTAMPYAAYVTPYSVSGEEYKPYFTPLSGATDVTSWFSLGKTEGTLTASGSATVPFTITVPKGTGGGSYFATVFVETHDKSAGSGVTTRKRVGMVVYLRVTGPAVEKGNVAQWSVPWLQEAPLKAMLKMANAGSVHYKADMKVTVRDLFGKKKYEFTRSPQILPQKLRALPVEWSKAPPFGVFKVGGEISYLGKTEQLPEKFVLVMSLPLRFLVLIVLLLGVGGVVLTRRNRAVAFHKK